MIFTKKWFNFFKVLNKMFYLKIWKRYVKAHEFFNKKLLVESFCGKKERMLKAPPHISSNLHFIGITMQLSVRNFKSQTLLCWGWIICSFIRHIASLLKDITIITFDLAVLVLSKLYSGYFRSSNLPNTFNWNFVNESKPIHLGPLKLRLIQ